MNIASASHTAPSTPTAVYTGETDFRYLRRYLLHNFGGPCWIRTNDQEIMSFLL